MRICLDPGHSGPYEPGACAGGVSEADINLAMARLLGQELTAAGHAVILTRSGPIASDGLKFRAELANQWEADVFLSLHCNAAATVAAKGVETFCFPGSQMGRQLAGHIQQALSEAGYTLDRGVKEANFAVLRLTAMPAVLVECGFLTNEQDRAVLADPAGQQRIAAAVAAGLSAFATEYAEYTE